MGGHRGRIISEADKQQVLTLISEACKAGARKRKAAEMLGLPIRTVQRWEKNGLSDRRKGSRAIPANKMSEFEKKMIESVLTAPEYEKTNPNQIVPILADQGIYVGSESTMYRILRELKMNKHRDSSKPARRKRPDSFIATGPNQIWSWDITYLPSEVKGKYYYLYLIMDIFSRMAVAYQVYESESSTLAADLITDACLREGIIREQLVLHSDNGSPMKGVTMLAKLQDLGVMPSFSRPSVSNDNPYSESLFRTLKYRPEYPERSFASLIDAREWADDFVNWYNHEHHHSAIRFVTPADRHSGKDIKILNKRHQVYLKAQKKHPERWSGNTRNWDHIDSVSLNKVNKPKVKSAEIIDMKVAA